MKRGEINLICVKDFSRFSRDYIETGNYLECTFPFMGVRFISINDGYDSEDYKGTTGGLEVVMRSIIYAAYSKDLSVKTTSAKVQMMKQGKYVGGYAPMVMFCIPRSATSSSLTRRRQTSSAGSSMRRCWAETPRRLPLA